MLGHQDPAEEQERENLTHLLQSLDKAAAETLGEKRGTATIGAAGYGLQMARAVGTVVESHGAEEYTLDDRVPEERPCGTSQTSQSCSLRQRRCIGRRGRDDANATRGQFKRASALGQ